MPLHGVFIAARRRASDLPPCHYSVVLPYAAYLRVYEPLTAFPEPERSTWREYAESARASIPGRGGSEHTEALRRLVASPPVVVPAEESRDAYIRTVDGVVYVCPWATRVRSWIALERFLATVPAGVAAAFVPPAVSARAMEAFRHWKRQRGSLRVHILSSTWRVPLPWFLSFDPAERWLVLEDEKETGGGRATATRALGYSTTLAYAGRRLTRVLTALRREPRGALPGAGIVELHGWLAGFHPRSLMELDYGGLVYLLDDEMLRSDQSVAEAAAAVTGLETGQRALTAAMYERIAARWRFVEALESAN